jgi:hypothetical protein
MRSHLRRGQLVSNCGRQKHPGGPSDGRKGGYQEYRKSAYDMLSTDPYFTDKKPVSVMISRTTLLTRHPIGCLP